MLIDLHLLHQNTKQWREPERFIPERFDHNSVYYFKPDSTKRHPYAFSPFFGGKRVCIGKTFAETVAKIVVPAFMSKLEFEFEDEKMKEKKTILNVDM